MFSFSWVFWQRQIASTSFPDSAAPTPQNCKLQRMCNNTLLPHLCSGHRSFGQCSDSFLKFYSVFYRTLGSFDTILKHIGLVSTRSENSSCHLDEQMETLFTASAIYMDIFTCAHHCCQETRSWILHQLGRCVNKCHRITAVPTALCHLLLISLQLNYTRKPSLCK